MTKDNIKRKIQVIVILMQKTIANVHIQLHEVLADHLNVALHLKNYEEVVIEIVETLLMATDHTRLTLQANTAAAVNIEKLITKTMLKIIGVVERIRIHLLLRPHRHHRHPHIYRDRLRMHRLKVVTGTLN